jgi:predicted regulator of Ras-like GTPase activity (Roadblock/LC7/MglB family)
MVQSLNKALDHSFSPKGIRWRIEAWRTGKPFAEVVLLHTLIYRTEQLLLIEPESGLLMQSVSADPGNEDADLVSSLLSAIQGFTRESFEHNTDEGSDLRVMRTNELTVLIEHGPQAILAAAVRGEIPVKFRTRMQAAAEQLHLQHGALLEEFNGDTALLEPVRVDLEELLESEYVDKKEEPKVTKPEPTWAKHLGWAIPTVLLFLALAWSLSAQRAKRQQRFESVLDLPPTASLTISESVLHLDGTARHEWLVHAKKRMERLPAFKLNASELVITDQNWVNFLEDLRGQLGIILVNTNRDDSGRYVLQGWRDPLAIDPDELLQKHGVNEEVQQTWEPYRSLDPRLTVERLKRQLGSFPDEVKLEPHEDTGWLYLRGTATRDWVQKLSCVIEDAELGHAVNISQLKIVDGF